MQSQQIGSVAIDTVVEMARWTVDPNWLLPPATRDGVQSEIDWLGSRCVEPGTEKFILSLHSFLIRTPHHTILFDTCCGNDKERGGAFPFHRLSTPYLDRLAAAGVQPEAVDIVMCTHLHADHIGWNTRLRNGRWVPTFPNTKYIISRKENDYWTKAVREETEIPMAITAYNDSVAPVIETGQAVLVEDDGAHDLFDDGFRLFPLNGHTPGHTGLLVTDGGRRALLTGDAIHHPVQFARPEWGSIGEVDAAAALISRRHIIEFCADTDTLLLTGHFPDPTAGHVYSHGNGARFRFL
ncbi:MAG TPA: MBL fold metallo-hydrolase [Rhizomicrobium sp.]|nr:MBL fold metallo-hydrolase [Rhizomicrobium sp.]